MPEIHAGDRSYFEAARWQPCLLVRQPLQTWKKSALQCRWTCGGWRMKRPKLCNPIYISDLDFFLRKKKPNRKVYETLLHDLRPQASTCFSINQLQSQVRDSAQSLWIPELYGCLGFKMLQASPVTTGTTPSHATEAILQDYHVPYMAWVGGWGSTGFSRSRSSILQV